jgi:hypothetical protein
MSGLCGNPYATSLAFLTTSFIFVSKQKKSILFPSKDTYEEQDLQLQTPLF